MIRNSILALLAVILFSCTDSQSQTDKTSFSAPEFLEKIQATKDAQVIDVRTPGEYEGGHIANARNINWNDDNFIANTASLDKSKPVFVYCLSGGRSGSAAKALRKEGFTTVYEMPGGMMEWRSKDLPLTTDKPVDAQAHSEMTLAQYNALLETDKTVVIDFYAEWCIPCKKMKSYLDVMTKELSSTVDIIRIDADKNPAICKELNVENLPTIKVYKNKNLVWDHMGYVDENTLREKIK